MALEEINAVDEVGQAFNKTNEAINNIIVSGSLNGNILTYTTFSGATIEVPLPVVESGTVLLTQSGAIEIAGVDPTCTVEVPALSYTYNGVQQNTLTASLPFVAPDATLDRVDVVVLNPVTNSVSIVNGVPSATPETPAIPDPNFLLGSIYVFGGQPCEDSIVIFSSIQQQTAEIFTSLNVALLSAGLHPDAVLRPWNNNYSYITEDVCQIDGVFYKALTDNVNKDPITELSDWQEIEGGAGFIASGVVYVDETFTGTPDGSYNAPYLDIKTAVASVGAGVDTEIKCLGANPVFGAGGAVDVSGKNIYINAVGKDLEAYGEFIISTGIVNMTIACNDFTKVSGRFIDGTFGDSNLLVKCDKQFTNTSGELLYRGNINIVTDYFACYAQMNGFGATSAYLDFNQGDTSGYIVSNMKVSCYSKDFLANVGIAFNNPFSESVFSGFYTTSQGFVNSGDNFTFKDFWCVSLLTPLVGTTSATLADAHFICDRDFCNNDSIDLKIIDAHITCGMVGQTTGEYGLQVGGNSNIDDLTLTVPANYNGVTCVAGSCDVSNSHINLGSATDTAFGDNIVDKGGNSFSPKLLINPSTPFDLKNQNTVIWDTTLGNKVLNLPSASASNGFEFTLKKKDASVNTITVNGNGGDLIDGSASYVLNASRESRTFICDGTSWYAV